MQRDYDLIDSIGPTDHVLGAPHAQVEVVEYGDFQCPTCKARRARGPVAAEAFRRPDPVRLSPLPDRGCSPVRALCRGSGRVRGRAGKVLGDAPGPVRQTAAPRPDASPPLRGRPSASTWPASGRRWTARAIGNASASRWKSHDAATCVRRRASSSTEESRTSRSAITRCSTPPRRRWRGASAQTLLGERTHSGVEPVHSFSVPKPR